MGVFHTGYGIIVELSRRDLGHPDRPGLLESITTPVGRRERTLLQCLKDYQGGDCQCALADKTPWMFVRRQRLDGKTVLVAAHLPVTHVATPEESDKHKAMKERIAQAASRHGLQAQTEARSSDGRTVTDVLVTGPGGRRIGWEAQYSPNSATTVRRRCTNARASGIAPLWVTSDEYAVLIDRAPWARVDDVPWQRIAAPLTLLIRGGVRHLQVWKCTPTSARPCPETGSACGRFHSGWFPPALYIPEERATALDEFMVTSADGEHVPVRARTRPQPPGRAARRLSVGAGGRRRPLARHRRRTGRRRRGRLRCRRTGQLHRAGTRQLLPVRRPRPPHQWPPPPARRRIRRRPLPARQRGEVAGPASRFPCLGPGLRVLPGAGAARA